MKQSTIGKSFTIRGIGLHTGGTAEVVFNPAAAGTGIVLMNEGERYRLNAGLVAGTDRGTVIKKRRSSISTVEHMLSAVKALAIDNVEICVKGREAPALDGSARGFALALRKAGLKKQAAKKAVFKLKEPVLLNENGKYMAALPGKGFIVRYFSDFSKRGILPQEAGLKVTPLDFIREISGARTFGFKEELEALKKAGLIKGASLKNAIVIEKGRPINGKLRYKNELARHKVLDLIGDFSFIEGEINMTVIAYKTGHTENIKMVKMLLNKN